MIDISLDLSNKLPSEQVNIIRQVVHAAENQGLRLFIVGAQARDLLLQHAYDLPVHRATNDIDFGIVVESWDEFTRLRDALIASEKFQSHKTMRQKLVHESGLLVDLVPFGDLEKPSGQIAWPPDFSVVMSTVGFREAYDNSIEVRIADDLIVKVASLAGLALMKIIAWDDRQFERDAQDLALIMKHYDSSRLAHAWREVFREAESQIPVIAPTNPSMCKIIEMLEKESVVSKSEILRRLRRAPKQRALSWTAFRKQLKSIAVEDSSRPEATFTLRSNSSLK